MLSCFQQDLLSSRRCLSVTKLVEEKRHLSWKSQSFYYKNVALAEVIPNNTNTPLRAYISYEKRQCIINTLRSREESFELIFVTMEYWGELRTL